MGLILDTSVLVAAERGHLAWERFLQSVGEESLFISAITVSELWHGYHRASASALPRRLTFIQGVESMLPALDFAVPEALVHAKIWAELEQRGQRIGQHDLLIAATALANNHSLATLNQKEFGRIPNLALRSLANFLLK